MKRVLIIALVLAVASLFLEADSVKFLRRSQKQARRHLTEPEQSAEAPEADGDKIIEDEKKHEAEAAAEEGDDDGATTEEKIEDGEQESDSTEAAEKSEDDEKATEAKESDADSSEEASKEPAAAEGDDNGDEKVDAGEEEEESKDDDDSDDMDDSANSTNSTSNHTSDDIANWESPHPSNFHKNIQNLPDQGFDEHSTKVIGSQKGHVGDWQEEWPRADESEEDTHVRICQDNPDNDWCKLWLADHARRHARAPDNLVPNVW